MEIQCLHVGQEAHFGWNRLVQPIRTQFEVIESGQLSNLRGNSARQRVHVQPQ